MFEGKRKKKTEEGGGRRKKQKGGRRRKKAETEEEEEGKKKKTEEGGGTGNIFEIMMKKEKSVRSSTTSAATIADDGARDLKSVIRDHSLFFDTLVELIPAKFYLPTDDAAKPWFQGLNKAAKQAAKLQTRDNLKKARRQRLDPGKSQISTLELLKQTLENEKQTNDVKIEGDDDEKDEQDEINPTSLGGDDQSVTYEELRQRLHRRIEELRGNRGSSESLRNQKRDNYQKKRKRENLGKDESGSHGKCGNVKETEGKIEKDVTEAIQGVEFGKVKLGGEEESGKKNKKRKLSKEKELQRVKKLEDAKKDPEKGEVVAKKHSWKAAVSRAAGVKVHDDPKLLKHRMKKEKKRHEKSAGKWKERVESREKMKEEKQQKRAGNISERIHQKKMRKIAKREKKLMRPGFEGRKEGYINEN